MNFFNISVYHARILTLKNATPHPIDTKYNVIDAASRVSRVGKNPDIMPHYQYVNRIIYFIRPFSFSHHETDVYAVCEQPTSGGS